jgi:hypothetical protein
VQCRLNSLEFENRDQLTAAVGDHKENNVLVEILQAFYLLKKPWMPCAELWQSNSAFKLANRELEGID